MYSGELSEGRRARKVGEGALNLAALPDHSAFPGKPGTGKNETSTGYYRRPRLQD